MKPVGYPEFSSAKALLQSKTLTTSPSQPTSRFKMLYEVKSWVVQGEAEKRKANEIDEDIV